MQDVGSFKICKASFTVVAQVLHLELWHSQRVVYYCRGLESPKTCHMLTTRSALGFGTGAIVSVVFLLATLTACKVHQDGSGELDNLEAPLALRKLGFAVG